MRRSTQALAVAQYSRRAVPARLPVVAATAASTSGSSSGAHVPTVSDYHDQVDAVSLSQPAKAQAQAPHEEASARVTPVRKASRNHAQACASACTVAQSRDSLLRIRGRRISPGALSLSATTIYTRARPRLDHDHPFPIIVSQAQHPQQLRRYRAFATASTQTLSQPTGTLPGSSDAPQLTGKTQPPPPETDDINIATMTSFYDLKAELPGADKSYDFNDLRGKTVLVVNVASKW